VTKHEDPIGSVCPLCNGTGVERNPDRTATGFPCPKCDGVGRVFAEGKIKIKLRKKSVVEASSSASSEGDKYAYNNSGGNRWNGLYT